MPTIIVGLILLAIVVYAVKRVKKEGTCTGCSSCTSSNSCPHSTKPPTENNI